MLRFFNMMLEVAFIKNAVTNNLFILYFVETVAN
jgi:hypothetical protein